MIRKIEKTDRQSYLSMAHDFYHSSAVLHPVPDSYIINTFDEMMSRDTFAAGYIIEHEGKVSGYALVSKTYSQEAGGMVWWLEELYIVPDMRGHGLGSEYFAYIEKEAESCGVKRLRLEVEPENVRAVKLYRSLGYESLEYGQMKKWN